MTDAAPATLTPDAARAEIDTLLADPTHPSNDPWHPRHAEALDKKLELYKTVYGTSEPGALEESAATLPTADTPPPEAGALELPPPPEGQDWNVSAVATIFDAATAHGLPSEELREWMVKGNERLAEGPVDPEAATAALSTRFGARTDAVLADARYVVATLEPPDKREVLEAWLDATGMGDDPDLIARLAPIGARLRQQRRVDVHEPAVTFGESLAGAPQFDFAALRTRYQRVYGTGPA